MHHFYFSFWLKTIVVVFLLSLWFTQPVIAKTDISPSTGDIIPNKGQIADFEGNVQEDVLFYSKMNGVTAYFKKDHVTYIFKKRSKQSVRTFRKLRLTNPAKAEEFEKSDSTLYYRLDLVFEGSSSSIHPQPKGKSSFETNYYYPHCSDGISNVYHYSSLVYQNVYPGVDLHFKQTKKGMKYDVVIHPKGSMKDVALAYKGADDMELRDNVIHMETPVGHVKEYLPASYQVEGISSKPIDVSYQLRENTVKFSMDQSTKGKTTVIDPTMVWSTYYNFEQSDIWGVHSDANSNQVVFLGRTDDSNLPTLDPGGSAYFQGSLGGNADLVILQFNTDGVRQWATYYGGTKFEYTKGEIVLDGSGNIFVAGGTNSDDFPTYNPGGGAYYEGSRTALTDIVAMKFNSNGVRQWATYYGTDLRGDAFGADVGPNGHFFLTGYIDADYTINTKDPGGSAYFQASQDNSYTFDDDGIIIEFDNNGGLVWATYFGIKGDERLEKVAIAPNGSIYIVGTAGPTSSGTQSPKLRDNGGYYDNTHNGGEDIYLVKFNSDRSWDWATYYGGSASDDPPAADFEISADGNNNMFVVGNTRSLDFPTYDPGGSVYHDGTYNGSSSGGSGDFASDDSYILKFDANQNRKWATYLGGNGWELRSDCDVGSNNKLYYICGTGSSNMPTQSSGSGHNDGSLGGNEDGYIVRFSNSGVMEWASYLGGPNGEEVVEISVSSSTCGPNIFTFGDASDSGYPTVDPGGGAYYDTYPGSGFGKLLITKFGGDTGTPGIWEWTGDINNDWFEPCNWDKGEVPKASSDVLIPGGTTRQPHIANGNAICNEIEINSSNGGRLEIEVTNNGHLEVTK